ncbi:MAG: outer membrane lipoprotein carrier protein LolA [Pseudobdellovibrionaceae bacterium]
MLKKLLAVALVLILTAGIAKAATPSYASDPVVKQAETYMKGFKSAKARFTQTAPDGSSAQGTFYIKRPGKLRFEYDAPLEDFVVADGLFIYFYDATLEQQSNAPIGQTLADFILRDNIKMSGDVTVTAISKTDDRVYIRMVQTADPQAGSITLSFTREPFQLKSWQVMDSQGQATLIELSNLQSNVALPNSLFAYHDPKPKGLNQ